MSDESLASDPVMNHITESVVRGRHGDIEGARDALLGIWAKVGVLGDPLYRCTLAHYLADLYADPAEALIWDIRSLDAADALTARYAREHHESLDVAGFYPSLHVNIADDLRRLSAFDAAAEHVASARSASGALAADGYGDTIRRAIEEIQEAISARDTSARASVPGPSR